MGRVGRVFFLEVVDLLFDDLFDVIVIVFGLLLLGGCDLAFVVVAGEEGRTSGGGSTPRLFRRLPGEMESEGVPLPP